MFGKDFVCLNCGTVGKPKTKVKGNLLIEIALWLLFLIPGIIYSLWRSGKAYKSCRACGSESLVPLDSPKGQEMVKKNK